MTTKPLRFSVTFEVPVGATRAQAHAYVEAAVRGWCGGLLPDEDPMASLDGKTVVVRRYKRRKGTKSEAEPSPDLAALSEETLRLKLRAYAEGLMERRQCSFKVALTEMKMIRERVASDLNCTTTQVVSGVDGLLTEDLLR